jgi:hypothetical protein
MRIVIPLDRKDRAIVETRRGEMTMAEVYKYVVALSGRTPGSIEKEAGLTHPTGLNFRKGSGDSLKTFAQMMDVLGYDLILKKREN